MKMDNTTDLLEVYTIYIRAWLSKILEGTKVHE